MIPLKKAVASSLGQKFIMALSGLGLIVFVIVHLLGNLTLYRSESSYFNHYAATLESYGKLLTVAEIGLLAVFLLHIFMGLKLKAGNRAARPMGYRAWRSKGGGGFSNSSSRNMVITGLVLLAFLILHIWQFRFGPGAAQGYTAQVGGESVRDLSRLVHEVFSSPIFVIIYMVTMVLLGLHLRHGFWSAFQTLGVTRPRTTRAIYGLGMAVAVLLAAGFFFIPIWIYLGIGQGGL